VVGRLARLRMHNPFKGRERDALRDRDIAVFSAPAPGGLWSRSVAGLWKVTADAIYSFSFFLVRKLPFEDVGLGCRDLQHLCSSPAVAHSLRLDYAACENLAPVWQTVGDALVGAGMGYWRFE